MLNYGWVPIIGITEILAILSIFYAKYIADEYLSVAKKWIDLLIVAITNRYNIKRKKVHLVVWHTLKIKLIKQVLLRCRLFTFS